MGTSAFIRGFASAYIGVIGLSPFMATEATGIMDTEAIAATQPRLLVMTVAIELAALVALTRKRV